jgi:hypothetical protein
MGRRMTIPRSPRRRMTIPRSPRRPIPRSRRGPTARGCRRMTVPPCKPQPGGQRPHEQQVPDRDGQDILPEQ